MTNDNNLRERVEQLEQTVERQAAVIERFLPDDPGKRRFLKAGAKGVGAVAGLGLAYDAGTESARAATGDAGQYGSAADRPDMFADTVDANLVSTDILGITENRFGFTNHGQVDDNTTVVLSDDYDSYVGLAKVFYRAGAVSGVGFYEIDEQAGNASLLISSDGSNWSATDDNDGTANVYWSSGNSRFELENKLGFQARFRVSVENLYSDV